MASQRDDARSVTGEDNNSAQMHHETDESVKRKIQHAHQSLRVEQVGGYKLERDTKPEVILEGSFLRSLRSLSWVIHAVAVCSTMAVLQLTFRNEYWFDEDGWGNQWFPFESFGMPQVAVLNLLQFVAKVHELMVIASLSAMVMHFVRRSLVGDGLRFGFLTAAHEFDSVLFFRRRFWWTSKPRTKKSDWRQWDYRPATAAAIFLGLCMYSHMVGPSSAIALIPSARWWDVKNPFRGEVSASYLNLAPDRIYPRLISRQSIQAGCNTTSDTSSDDDSFQSCPGGGYQELRRWAKSYARGGPDSEMDITQRTTNIRRKVISTLDFGKERLFGDILGRRSVYRFPAFATTVHSSVADLAGLSWNYLQAENVAGVADIQHPRISATQQTFSPFVQVQCRSFRYSQAREFSRNNTTAIQQRLIPHFDTRALRNFSTAFRREGYVDWYRTWNDGMWPLPEEYWNYTREDLSTTNFTWIDAARLFPDKGPSIGSLVTLPETLIRTDPNGTEYGVQESLIIPCMVDARWMAAEVSLEPKADNLVRQNISNDLSELRQYWEIGEGLPVPVPWALTARNIPVTPEWADLLDRPVRPLRTGGGERADNLTAIPALLASFIYNTTHSDGRPRTFFPPQGEGESAADINDRITRIVARIISHVLADGLSRVSSQSQHGLMLRDNGNGTVGWVNLDRQTGFNTEDPYLENKTIVQRGTAVRWDLQRYGYGWGWADTTIIFSASILLIHTGAVVVYAVYIFRFRLSRRGWSSADFGSLDEVLSLALASREPDLLGDKRAGVVDRDIVRARVVVRERNDERVEMVLGSAGLAEIKLRDGKKYR